MTWPFITRNSPIPIHDSQFIDFFPNGSRAQASVEISIFSLFPRSDLGMRNAVFLRIIPKF